MARGSSRLVGGLAGLALALLVALAGGAAETPPPPAPSAAPLTPPAAVARSLRAGDLAEASRLLAAASVPASDPRARLWLGLAAFQRGAHAEAESHLGAAQGADAELEDWRLFLLGESAASLGHRPLARAAFERLAAEAPGSPLLPRAWLRLAELATADAAPAEVLRWATEARRAAVVGENAVRLEQLAWQAARASGDRAALLAAGRRLLVMAPLESERLQVVETLRSGGASFELGRELSAAELTARAAAQLAAQLPQSALDTLEAVASGERDLTWRERRAEALLALDRGIEALALLAEATPADPRERSRLEWARARAALATATVARGQRPLPVEQRSRLREAADGHLHRAGLPGGDPEISRRALRELFARYDEADRVDDALAVLTRLAALDARDSTGARPLWERGWREYRGRNWSGAIGTWSELFQRYPQASHARSGRYWTARAYAELGERERAEALFRELAAAQPADFYARHASQRLRGSVAILADESAAGEPWPTDPRLARARRLSEGGIELVAAQELDLVAAEAAPRAVHALRGVLLARQGERRESLRLLRRAFPVLGTPLQAQAPPEAIELFYPLDYAETVARLARDQNLPVPLVLAVIHQESAFDARAKSRAGARGLMQLMPATGRELAKQLRLPFAPDRLYQPDYSVRLGTTYLRRMLNLFGGNLELALAGYNGGPGRIGGLWRRAGPSPELDAFLEGLAVPESRDYVKRILVLSDGYRRLYPTLG